MQSLAGHRNRRSYRTANKYERFADPTPEDIERLSAEIRANWSPLEKHARKHYQLGPMRAAGICSPRRLAVDDCDEGVELQVVVMSELVTQ